MNNDDFRLDSQEEREVEENVLEWCEKRGKYKCINSGVYYPKWLAKGMEIAGLCVIEE